MCQRTGSSVQFWGVFLVMLQYCENGFDAGAFGRFPAVGGNDDC